MKRLFLLLCCISFATVQCFAQRSINKKDAIITHLKAHEYYLASDKLEGRLTGTKYERMAGDYIRQQFQRIGLQPKGDNNTWFEAFSFHTGYSYGNNNSLVVNGQKLRLDKDFYPLVYSASGKAEGSITEKSDPATIYFIDDGKPDNDIEGKVVLISLKKPSNDNPHDLYKKWREEYNRVKVYKPAAILFYNSKDSISVHAYRMFNNIQQDSTIMLMISDSVANYIKSLKSATASISVDISHKQVQGRNVIGYIDNHAANTIIIGAHYDHLGHNEYGNSLYVGPPAIHNGADDNASGTSSLIELARLIKSSNLKHYNYEFVAFSGEELGLLGSNYFTKHNDLSHVDCMLNMDMVGRLDSVKNELGINGVGTSPTWDSVIYKVQPIPFKIKTTASGMGNSDHSSFYLQDVPAIHFFSGNHKDYHKPSDDPNKINYAGMEEIVEYIYHLTSLLDDHPRLTFKKTKEDSSYVPAFKVTLGIIPDYFFEGPGIRIDGISPGKTAEKAGLKAGDVIMKLGNYDVKDMQAYMEGLTKFNKGDKTNVTIKRGNDTMSVPVEFK